LEGFDNQTMGVAAPRLIAEFHLSAAQSGAAYRSMSTVELIDASPIPILITYAELDLLQMQVQAGELFARLVTQHGFAPQLKVIAGHNHLTQTYAVNTGDEALSGRILDFVRGPDTG